jgi:hypothetical protein
MHLRLSALLLLLFAAPAAALASPFDGWTVAQIRSHPDFVAAAAAEGSVSMSRATASSAPQAPRVYEWIGYIPISAHQRVYFTAEGYGLTCGAGLLGPYMDEWAPLWMDGAIDKLYATGVIQGYP